MLGTQAQLSTGCGVPVTGESGGVVARDRGDDTRGRDLPDARLLANIKIARRVDRERLRPIEKGIPGLPAIADSARIDRRIPRSGIDGDRRLAQTQRGECPIDAKESLHGYCTVT